MGFAVDLHEDFVQVPAPVRIGPLMNAAFPYFRGEHRTEPVPPEPHRLVAEMDTALAKNILDLRQRQRIPDVHQHREANNLGRQVEIPEWVYNSTGLKNGFFCLKPFRSDIAPHGYLNVLAARAMILILTLKRDGFLTRLLAQLTHNRFRVIPGHLSTGFWPPLKKLGFEPITATHSS